MTRTRRHCGSSSRSGSPRTEDVTGADRGRPEGDRARRQSSVSARLALADLYRRQRRTGRRRARARAGHHARPRGAGRVSRARAAVRRAEELRQGARGPRAARRRAAQSRPGALSCSDGSRSRPSSGTTAIAALKRAIEIDPDHDASWSALGFVYESRNQPEQAIDLYKTAIKVNPDNPGLRRTAQRPARPPRPAQGGAGASSSSSPSRSRGTRASG